MDLNSIIYYHLSIWKIDAICFERMNFVCVFLFIKLLNWANII